MQVSFRKLLLCSQHLKFSPELCMVQSRGGKASLACGECRSHIPVASLAVLALLWRVEVRLMLPALGLFPADLLVP